MTESELLDMLDDDSGTDELEQQIPLPTPEEEAEMNASDVPDELPILVLRNTVLFPGVVLPITVGPRRLAATRPRGLRRRPPDWSRRAETGRHR